MKTTTSERTFPAVAAAAVIVGAAGLLLLAAGCSREPGTFATPEKAVAALDELIGSEDTRAVEEMFGPGSAELFSTGDRNEDLRIRERVKGLIAERVAFEEIDADTRVAYFGEEDWPFPIPLVRTGERWRFDTEAGREEMLNRRIGYYELQTLSSLHELVDAQIEYAAEGRDGNPRAFAHRFRSSEGRRDGLYWPPVEGEPLSPLGDLLAAADVADPEPEPFQGYHYRMLTGQGGHAPGGARSYLDAGGLLTGGFAAVAWPAKYGNSGVMTFVVNHRDIVFQKDLGPDTESAAAAIELFDPDPSWGPTADRLEEAEAAAAAADEATDEAADEPADEPAEDAEAGAGEAM